MYMLNTYLRVAEGALWARGEFEGEVHPEPAVDGRDHVEGGSDLKITRC